jgi:hypothetical protein
VFFWPPRAYPSPRVPFYCWGRKSDSRVCQLYKVVAYPVGEQLRVGSSLRRQNGIAWSLRGLYCPVFPPWGQVSQGLCESQITSRRHCISGLLSRRHGKEETRCRSCSAMIRVNGTYWCKVERYERRVVWWSVMVGFAKNRLCKNSLAPGSSSGPAGASLLCHATPTAFLEESRACRLPRSPWRSL